MFYVELWEVTAQLWGQIFHGMVHLVLQILLNFDRLCPKFSDFHHQGRTHKKSHLQIPITV